MAKVFDTEAATSKFFNTKDPKEERDEYLRQHPPKRKYRYNLNLDEDLDAFLHKIAWEKRTSITQYLNDLIRAEKETYLANGGDLSDWSNS